MVVAFEREEGKFPVVCECVIKRFSLGCKVYLVALCQLGANLDT